LPKVISFLYKFLYSQISKHGISKDDLAFFWRLEKKMSKKKISNVWFIKLPKGRAIMKSTRNKTNGIAFLITLLLLIFVSSCKDLNNISTVRKILPIFWPEALSGNERGKPNPDISRMPTVAGLPEGIKQENVLISNSSVPLPMNINNSGVPIGKVYDISLQLDGKPIAENSNVQFNEPVKLIYEYDKVALKDSGFTEDIFVYYFDYPLKKWLPVKSVKIDSEKGIVTALTDHFTPFVLVAAPAVPNTTTPIPPACIASDFPGPNPLGTKSGAMFMTVDLNSRYYQDRNYIFDGTDSTTINTFNNLGFNNALGISVCNGGIGVGSVGGINCQTNNSSGSHKDNTIDNDYITFIAHTNLDLYLIYYDTAIIAPWVNASGFMDTGMRINTTVVGTTLHRVYKKTYLKGEAIQLEGNKNGGGDSATNYFVILKRAGDTTNGYASNLCEKKPDYNPPINISKLKGIPGTNKILLQWENPDDINMQNVVVRRGTISSPINMGDGISPAGSALNDNTFEVTGLAPNSTYYFSVFALDKNGKWMRNAIAVTTGVDSDNDDLTDAFENNPSNTYANGLSLDNAIDTDGDGTDDRQEIINGTDPTVADTIKPTVTNFYNTTPYQTQFPLATFQATGTDDVGIIGWYVSYSSTPPLGSDTRWQTSVPIDQTLTAMGVFDFYIWAKDKGGNVSNAFPPRQIELNGIKVPKFLYETNDLSNTLGAYNIDVTTGMLSHFQTINYPPHLMAWGRGPLGITIHPNGKYVYVTDGMNIYSYSANKINGQLTQIDAISLGNRINDPSDQIYSHPSGKTIFAFNSGSTVFRVFTVNGNGSLSLQNTIILGNYIYNREDIGYYRAVFSVDTSDKVKLTTIGYGDLFFTPINAFKNKFNLNFAGNQANIGFLNNFANKFVPMFAFAGAEVIAPINFPYHIMGSAVMNFDQFGGTVSSIDPPFLFTEPFGPNDIPYGFISETNSISRFGFSNSRFGSYLGQAGFLNLERKNLYKCNKDSEDPNPNISGIISFCTINASYDLNFNIANMHLDPTGHFLYVPDHDDANNGAHYLNAFKVDQNNGNLTAINTDVVNSASVFDVKVLDLHDFNDPPIVNIQKPIAQYQNIDAPNNTIYLNGSYSYDPDYVRCEGNPANFVYKWTLIGNTAGSTKTSADIVNSDTLSSAYFVPDKTGDYNFQLSFTDDHGTCIGANKTTYAYMTVRMRRIKSTGPLHYFSGEMINGRSKNEFDLYTNSNRIKWIEAGRKNGAEISIGNFGLSGVVCLQGTASMLGGCGLVPFVVIYGETYETGKALSYANVHDRKIYTLFVESWKETSKKIEATLIFGHWTYWDL
jgi:hypothetical protein